MTSNSSASQMSSGVLCQQSGSMNSDDEHMSDRHVIDVNDAIMAEIRGLRQGLICSVALLITLLEEGGTLDEGGYQKSITQALRMIEEDDANSPEARVLAEFVRILSYADVDLNRVQ